MLTLTSPSAPENIPTIQEEPVKSLGRWYTKELRDTRRVKETAQQVNGTLEMSHRQERTTGNSGKLKLCRIWSHASNHVAILVYDVAMSHVEATERKINNYVKKWLGPGGWELLAS